VQVRLRMQAASYLRVKTNHQILVSDFLEADPDDRVIWSRPVATETFQSHFGECLSSSASDFMRLLGFISHTKAVQKKTREVYCDP
jgi:hypothetical protein